MACPYLKYIDAKYRYGVIIGNCIAYYIYGKPLHTNSQFRKKTITIHLALSQANHLGLNIIPYRLE